MDRWYRIFADKRTIAGVFLFIAIVLGGALWYLERKVNFQTLERLSDQLSLAFKSK
jgi:Na+/H+-dicarboxylate symporter